VKVNDKIEASDLNMINEPVNGMIGYRKGILLNNC